MKFKDNFFSSVAFMVGNTVGGGVLALPIVAGRSGFKPAMLACFLTFFMMLVSGLFLFEVLWKTSRNGQTYTLVEVYTHYFGRFGRWIFQTFFLFLFVCLLTAYLSGMTSSIQALLPMQIGSTSILCLVALLFGFILFKGLHWVTQSNNCLVVLLFVLLVCLLSGAIQSIHLNFLKEVHWKFFLETLPVFLCSYGFHNTLPVVNQLLKNDRKRARLAILVSASLTFLINLGFLTIILGNLPLHGSHSIWEAFANGLPATVPLSKALQSSWILIIGGIFSLLALTTSYLAVGESVIKFLEEQKTGRMGLFFVVWVIPAVIALVHPHLFLKAIGLAAGIGSNVIFGILPGIMVIRRFHSKWLRVVSLCVVLAFLAVLWIEVNYKFF